MWLTWRKLENIAVQVLFPNFLEISSPNFISLRAPRSRDTSRTNEEKTINSDTTVKRAMMLCFQEAQIPEDTLKNILFMNAILAAPNNGPNLY